MDELSKNAAYNTILRAAADYGQETGSIVEPDVIQMLSDALPPSDIAGIYANPALRNQIYASVFEAVTRARGVAASPTIIDVDAMRRIQLPWPFGKG